MRNNSFLEELIELYPDYGWDISSLVYGVNKPHYYNSLTYDFLLDKNICIPLSLINEQINHDNFDPLMNNSDLQSITSLDWDFCKLIQHQNFNTRLFLELITDNKKLLDFILNSNINLSLNLIFKELSKRNYLPLSLINEYDIWDWESISSNLNLNSQFLLENVNKHWNIESLSENPQFNIDWVEIFPNLLWNWKLISKNKKIQLSWILKYPDKEWSVEKIIQSQNFELSWLKTLRNLKGNLNSLPEKIVWEKCHNLKYIWFPKFPKYRWSFFELSHHSNFDFIWLNSFPNEKWDWDFLSLKYGITIEILKKYSRKWSLDNLVINKSFSIDWVVHFQDWNWSFNYISCTKNVSLDWLKSFPKAKWNYQQILLKRTLNKQLISYISSKINKDNWQLISKNKSFNINWVSRLNYHLLDWYHGISKQDTLDITWIKKYPYANWNIQSVIQSRNILIDDFSLLRRLFDLEINDFSLNPNLSLDFIQQHFDSLDFQKLSFNQFNGVYHLNIHKIKLKKKELSVYGEQLIEKTWHPSRFWDWCLDIEDKL